MGRTHPNLVGHWRMENNLLDTSGNGNDGTPNGSPSYIKGAFGNAVSLNASTPDYVTIPHSSSLSFGGSFTICGWCRITGNPGDTQTIYRKGGAEAGGIFLNLSDQNNRRFRPGYYRSLNNFNQISRNDGIDCPLNEWFFFAAIFNQSNLTLSAIVNQNRVNQTFSQELPASPSVDAAIGYRLANNDRPLAGDVDNFQIWNRALQPHHIRAIYNGVDPAFIGDVA